MGEDAGRDMSEHTGTLRVTIREAAARLGVTEGAIRKRVKRGSLLKEQGEDGRVYVHLPVSHDASHEQSRSETRHLPDSRDELIAQLRGEVEAWRDESRRKDTIIMNMTEAMKALSPPVQAEPEEPPAETPQEPREYAVTPTPQPGRVAPQPSVEAADEAERAEPHPAGRDAQEPSETLGGPGSGTARGSWWRRMFGR